MGPRGEVWITLPAVSAAGPEPSGSAQARPSHSPVNLNSLNSPLCTTASMSSWVGCPVCAWCRQIRDGDGAWQPIEHYVAKHFDGEATHALCPACLEKHFPGA